MNEKYLYLFLDFFAISIPFAFSFYKKAPFYKKWKFLSLALVIPALIFIAWDEWFTQMGVWGFNPRYLSGWYVGSLPVEEILFFFCIPYACVFTYEALNYFFKKDFLSRHQTLLTYAIGTMAFVIGLLNADKWYTATTFLGLGLFLILINAALRPSYLGSFFRAYAVILIPFFLINGILTGTGIEEEVVWYNAAEQLDFRIGTIPVEDIFYGMLLIAMNVVIFEWLQKLQAERILLHRMN